MVPSLLPQVLALLLAVVAAWALLRARAANRRYTLLAEHTTDTVSRHHPDGTVTYVSPNAERVLGLAPDRAPGTALRDLCHPDDRDALRDAFSRAMDEDEPTGVMYRVPDGKGWRPVEMTLEPVRDARGRVTEVVASTRDITARVEAERVLRASQKLHRMVLDHLPDAIVTVYDPELHIVALHGADLAARGVDRAAHLGKRLRVAAPEDAQILEPELIRALAGEERLFECEGANSGRRYEVSLVPYRDAAGTPIGVISVTRDVTSRHELEQQLRHLADHDALTGLANRRRFTEELERHSAHAQRYGADGAVLLVDLDNFKQINDTLGHAVGDQVIARAADVLRDTLRVTDIVARLGGDEFAILLPHGDAEKAAETAARIVGAMRVAAEQWGVTVSVGVAAFGEAEAAVPDAVVAAADHAMYEVKRRGRDGFAVWPGASPSRQAA